MLVPLVILNVGEGCLEAFVKPYLAASLEHLPGGFGIMADDVAAGLYANLLLRVFLLVWPVA